MIPAGPFLDRQVGQLGQGDVGPDGRGHQYPLEAFQVVPEFPVVPEVDRIALQPLHGVGDVHAADGGHDHLLDVGHGEAVPGDIHPAGC